MSTNICKRCGIREEDSENINCWLGGKKYTNQHEFTNPNPMHTKDCLKDLVLEGDPCTCQEKEEKHYNLRDNPDGTCNCRPLGNSCFFLDGFGNRCDCPCHHPAEDWAVEFDKKFDDVFNLVFQRRELINFTRQTLSKQKSNLLQELEDKIPKEVNEVGAREMKSWDFAIGYNQCRYEILNILKSLQ